MNKYTKSINNQCSEIFMESFASNTSSQILECSCGRIHFDSYNIYDYLWNQELKSLLEKERLDGDKYISHDNSIGSMIISEKEIVMHCKCDIAMKYEKFIIENKNKILKYLNKIV